jgi:cell division protease FtsH
LDEVYTSAGQTGDSDTDADIYHELSSKITTNEVKDALRKRFQPEQISRFGNNHVIYPSLSKHSYQMIIKTTCDRYVADMAKLTGINFILSQNILDEIYVNSVYPTQGTRPVFSSIHKIFSSALTMIAVWGLENNHNYIFLDIDVERRVILGISDRDDQKETTEVPVDLDIRTNKAMTTEDFITMISVHEAGHGLVMMLTNGEVPKEINVSLAAWKGGYTYQSPHDVTTREQLVNEMMMGLGGGTAERVVFGRDNQSSGNATDLNRVTTLASNYVRSYGFGNNSSYIHLGDDPLCNTDVLETNKEVEDLVHRCRNATTTLLVDNKEYLMRLVDALIAKRQIGQDEIIAMFPELNLVPCKIVKYRELWNAFKA